ncbi:MAG: 3-hydroxyacyl-CoA dehydrogenase NAD-binding domain-containing protein [Candidatus Jordarchaeaceae archaeon]
MNERREKIVVVGPGPMGCGIALSFALEGYEVSLVGRSKERLKNAISRISLWVDSLKREGIEMDTQPIIEAIKVHTDMKEGVREATLIIEAVPEDIEIKKQVFRMLDKLCPSMTIFATNTSGLSVSEMASVTSRPDRFLGTHFWNPAHLIPLVEVVKGEKTGEEILALIIELLRKIKKEPVIVRKEVPGFIGTRLHQALIREAFHIVEQGVASIEDIDRVVKYSFGRRLAVTGPFETCDLGGLDVFLSVSEQWQFLSDAKEPSLLLKKKVKEGKLGAKTGEGFYVWDRDRLQNVAEERERILIYFLKKDGRWESDVK